MTYSKSGAAERDAVFTTVEKPFGKVLWTCAVYEPPPRRGPPRAGAMASIRLELELTDANGLCAVDWTMRFTAASPLFPALLRRRMSEKAFAAMTDDRERQLAEFFAIAR